MSLDSAASFGSAQPMLILTRLVQSIFYALLSILIVRRQLFSIPNYLACIPNIPKSKILRALSPATPDNGVRILTTAPLHSNDLAVKMSTEAKILDSCIGVCMC